jgi:two-component system sensor histidine kinase YesM
VFDRRYELTVFQPAVFGGNWSTVEWKDAERDLLLLRSRNNLLGWQVVWAMDRKELLVPLQRNISYSWFLVMLSFVLSLIVAWAISLFISRPINQIAGSMDRVGAGQWDTAIPVTRRDELGRLANHFNRMTNTIRELIADLQRTEKAKKESDFRALQTQIRPHFLFNTFNSISIAAKEHQPDKVDLLITSLTETLHYSLERSPAPVTLDEELRAVQSYIQLMQLRYDNRFSVLTDIDESTAGFVIPKFTLQPLIENCIFHGLIPKEGVGTLFVGSTRYRDTWDIIIEDTGVGIASDTLGALLDKLNGNAMESGIPEFEHIGLSNVHYRLKLMFGERYQLEMTSSKQSGTRIVLSLPIAFE